MHSLAIFIAKTPKISTTKAVIRTTESFNVIRARWRSERDRFTVKEMRDSIFVSLGISVKLTGGRKVKFVLLGGKFEEGISGLGYGEMNRH